MGNLTEKVKRLFEDINWKITGALVSVPWISETADSVVSNETLFDDIGDYVQAFGESLVLGTAGIYLSKILSGRKKAQEEAKEDKKFLETMIDGISDIIAIQNPDHSIVRYNKSGYGFLEKTYEEVKGKKCYELIGRNKTCDMCATEIALKSKKLEIAEKYVPELNKYLECRSNPVLDDQGNVKFIIEHLRDITDKKILENKIIENEKKFRTYFESSPIGIIVSDKNKNLIDANPASCSILGYSLEELKKMNILQIHPREDISYVKKEFENVIEKGKSSLEARINRKDSSYRDISLDVVMINNNVMGFFRDITELKKAEQALIDEKELNVQALEALDAWVSVNDSKSCEILYANDLFKKKFGEDSIGKKCYEVVHKKMGLDENLKELCPLNNIKDNTGNMDFEHDGRYYHVTVKSAKKEFIHIIRDITEQKSREKELEKIVNERTEILMRQEKHALIGRLSAAIAHDLSNYVSAVTGNIGLFYSGYMPKLQEVLNPNLYGHIEETFSEINKSGNQLIELINDLKKAARGDESNSVFRKIDLYDVIHGSINMNHPKYKHLLHPKIDVKKESYIKGDDSKIRRVFNNLIENSIYALKEKNKTDDAYCAELNINVYDKEKEYAIEFYDNGPGMKKETLENLFKVFFTTKEEGTGLGMMICKSIVEEHGGKISAKSSFGEGTQFYINLPKYGEKLS